MPSTFKPLPPDHPTFSMGPSFVFKEEEPLDTTPAGDAGHGVSERPSQDVRDDDSSTQPSESEGE